MTGFVFKCRSFFLLLSNFLFIISAPLEASASDNKTRIDEYRLYVFSDFCHNLSANEYNYLFYWLILNLYVKCPILTNLKCELLYDAHFKEDEGIIMHSQFQPDSPKYKENVIANFNRQEVMKTVNASILAIRQVEIEKVFIVN